MSNSKISADEAHAIRKDHLRTGSDGKERLLKVASAPTSWDPTTRSARFVMTSQAEDRYSDVVVTSGIDLTAFNQNPVAPLQHNSSSWPIGDWTNVEKMTRTRPPRMEGDMVLHEPGGPIPEIDQAAWMIERGYMRACSIGFLPDWNEVEKVLDASGSWNGGIRFNKSELLECSLCAIPANPQALAKGLFDGGKNIAQEAIDRILDDWARDTDGSLVDRKSFEEVYQIVKRNDEADISAVVEGHISQMPEDAAISLLTKILSAKGRKVASPGETVISQSRLVNVERAAKMDRLAKQRQRSISIAKIRGK